jgi:glycosyltransferase involved in cell wall biosynthesis
MLAPTALIALITSYGYLLIFLLAIVEGPIVSILAGFVSSLGYLHILPAYAIVVPSRLRVLRALRQAPPDVIHSQTFLGLGLDALAGARRLSIPIVGTNHTAIRAFAPYMPVKLAWAERFVLWYYNRCDLVTAPSRSVFEELGVDRLRPPLAIISNPLDLATFRPAPEGRSAAPAADPGLKGATLVYAGRLAAEKSIDTILRAVALLPDAGRPVTLALAGHGAAERPLRALAAELGIGRRVLFTGTLAKPQLARLFQQAEIFVNMSASETQSMALLQAMACGLPAVGANCRALPEFIGDTRGFVIDCRDHVALAERIGLLLANSDLRAALGHNAAAFARRFSIEAVADQWERAYRGLADRAAARA